MKLGKCAWSIILHKSCNVWALFTVSDHWSMAIASSTRDAGIVHSYFPSLLSEQMYGSLQQKNYCQGKTVSYNILFTREKYSIPISCIKIGEYLNTIFIPCDRLALHKLVQFVHISLRFKWTNINLTNIKTNAKVKQYSIL